MNKVSALIFGCNGYTHEIVKNIKHKYENIIVFKHKDESRNLELERSNVEIFDFTESWSFLKDIYDLDNSISFCVLEDDAENIFLTISLRSTFEELNIIALSKNKESATKLTMAGANKVIPMVQTTASIISDILDKPIVTDVLHSILYEKSDLKIAEIEITNESFFNGKYPSDIEWSKKYGVIIVSIIHEDLSSEFIYSSKAKHHAIKDGDIFVVIGYEADIKEFKRFIGRN